ncbi:MAG: hypothetical protein B7Z14_16235 [Bosea sp. 32-68-6]|nr:MAG: hypothetical protein B7Z14_16235 [Bosea sp. 32-68-6]
MKLADYQDIHQDRSQFIVVPGHEVDKIENTIHAEEQYKVVKKIHVVQEPVSKLNKTDIKNV